MGTSIANSNIYKLIHQDPPNKGIFFYYMFETNPLRNYNLTVKESTIIPKIMIKDLSGEKCLS